MGNFPEPSLHDLLKPKIRAIVAARRASEDDKKNLIQNHDVFIFDCDGGCGITCKLPVIFSMSTCLCISSVLVDLKASCSTALHQDQGPATSEMPVSLCLMPKTAGVIWRGDSLIEGVPETLDLLRSLVSFLNANPIAFMKGNRAAFMQNE